MRVYSHARRFIVGPIGAYAPIEAEAFVTGHFGVKEVTAIPSVLIRAPVSSESEHRTATWLGLKTLYTLLHNIDQCKHV